MTTTYLRCPSCRHEVSGSDVRHEDYLAISNCCDEICERVFLCETCGDREQHTGCTQCLSCICDSVIADPRELEQCTPELATEIARALAERLRPWLRQPQAGGPSRNAA